MCFQTTFTDTSTIVLVVTENTVFTLDFYPIVVASNLLFTRGTFKPTPFLTDGSEVATPISELKNLVMTCEYTTLFGPQVQECHFQAPEEGLCPFKPRLKGDTPLKITRAPRRSIFFNLAQFPVLIISEFENWSPNVTMQTSTHHAHTLFINDCCTMGNKM